LKRFVAVAPFIDLNIVHGACCAEAVSIIQFTDSKILLVLDSGVIVTDNPFGVKEVEVVTKVPVLDPSTT
jgi:hypothetical protein